jgi:hypothetical protein
MLDNQRSNFCMVGRERSVMIQSLYGTMRKKASVRMGFWKDGLYQKRTVFVSIVRHFATAAEAIGL